MREQPRRAQAAELAEGLRRKYVQAGKAERGRLLDAFCAATNYHRKAAIRLLGRGEHRAERDQEVVQHDPMASATWAQLWQVWEVSGRSCGRCGR